MTMHRPPIPYRPRQSERDAIAAEVIRAGQHDTVISYRRFCRDAGIAEGTADSIARWREYEQPDDPAALPFPLLGPLTRCGACGHVFGQNDAVQYSSHSSNHGGTMRIAHWMGCPVCRSGDIDHDPDICGECGDYPCTCPLETDE